MGRAMKRDLRTWCPREEAESIKRALLRAVARYMSKREDCPVMWTRGDTVLKSPAHTYTHNESLVSSLATSRGVPTAVWATDGSCIDGRVGYGLVSGVEGGKQIKAGVDGPQTNNTAEAMAILHALLDTDGEVALTIITDSQISIDSINTLLARGNPSHRLVCNYAVFRTICDIIKTRAPGSVTRVKVKAHEIDEEGEDAAATTEQLMNKGADVCAKKATEPGEGPILLQYPFHNLKKAVLKDEGVMCEV